jgi:hypothetical protein
MPMQLSPTQASLPSAIQGSEGHLAGVAPSPDRQHAKHNVRKVPKAEIGEKCIWPVECHRRIFLRLRMANISARQATRLSASG